MAATVTILSTGYRVYFFKNEIFTIITSDGDTVKRWINEIQRPNLLIAGLGIHFPDSEDSTDAVIELCVGGHCLIYKFDRTTDDHYPGALLDFLRNGEYIFIVDGDDLDKLCNHGILASDVRFMDFRQLTRERFSEGGRDEDIRNEEERGPRHLWELAAIVLEKELVDMPESLMYWWWDSLLQEVEIVRYTCSEAFMLFEIGRVLNAREYKLRLGG